MRFAWPVRLFAPGWQLLVKPFEKQDSIIIFLHNKSLHILQAEVLQGKVSRQVTMQEAIYRSSEQSRVVYGAQVMQI